MSSIATVELLSMESHVDNEVSLLQLPHPNRDISFWHILTVFEDSLRFLYTGEVEKDLIEIFIFTDLNKYSLRHCLDNLFTRCDARYGMPPPKRTIPPVYTRATEFFMWGRYYSSITKVFTPLHAGHSTAHKLDENKYEIKHSEFIDSRYAALEVINHGKEHVPDITIQIYRWFRNHNEQPIFLSLIEKSTKIRNKFVTYEYGKHAILLQEEMWQRPVIIPEKWIFPWGSAFETNALINSLLIRCSYHFLAVNLTARKSGHSGGADSSLVLAINKTELCHDLSFFADIGDEKIALFVDYMTYGFKTETPDPALQPIIPTVNGQLLIPCLHTITGDLQRNILSLMARVNSAAFNKQSKLFEYEMTKSLEKHFDKFPIKQFNKTIKINGENEEFDVLLADTSSRTLIILELRWILQPGDPREVVNKIKECEKKVLKLEKKIDFCKRNLQKIVNLISPNSSRIESFEDWHVRGAIVIDGFGGILSKDQYLPIITSEILKIGLSEINTLESLIEWIQSLIWLPQVDVHFRNGIIENRVDTNLIQYPGIELLDAASQYREYVYMNAQEFK